MKRLVAVLNLLVYVSALPSSRPGPLRHMALRVETDTKEEVHILRAAAENDYELDFWTYPRLNGKADVMIPKHRFQELRDQWTNAGMVVSIMQEDVEQHNRQMAKTNQGFKLAPVFGPRETTLDHIKYRSYNEIVATLKVLSSLFGERMILKESDSWRTYENRTIPVVELKTLVGGRNEDDRPVIMYEANMHAREWITNAAVLYTIDWLLTNYHTNPDAKYVLDNYRLVFLPMVNPDGYEYSWTNDRLWRKNRRPFSESCIGVDLNRNFDFNWASASDSHPYMYPGPSADSELETQTVVDVFEEYKTSMVMYFAVHAYSQLLLLPWGYMSSEEPVNTQHEEMGEIMASAMSQAEGGNFIVGTPYKAIGYTANGASLDWALAMQNNDTDFLSITYEMRPEYPSTYGFALPASEIVPAGHEFRDSLIVAAVCYDKVVGDDEEEDEDSRCIINATE